MLNDQKLGNYLEVSYRTNQFQIQVVRERGPVVETSVIQTRSSEDSKDPHIEIAHERTR